MANSSYSITYRPFKVAIRIYGGLFHYWRIDRVNLRNGLKLVQISLWNYCSSYLLAWVKEEFLDIDLSINILDFLQYDILKAKVKRSHLILDGWNFLSQDLTFVY